MHCHGKSFSPATIPWLHLFRLRPTSGLPAVIIGRAMGGSRRTGCKLRVFGSDRYRNGLDKAAFGQSLLSSLLTASRSQVARSSRAELVKTRTCARDIISARERVNDVGVRARVLGVGAGKVKKNCFGSCGGSSKSAKIFLDLNVVGIVIHIIRGY